MANTLKNTVSFSGADITVIAYRNTKNMTSPAAQFKADAFSRELRDINSEIERLKKEQKQLENEYAAAQSELKIVTSRSEQEVLTNNEFLLSSELKAAEGKYQNRMTEISQRKASKKDELKAALIKRKEVEEAMKKDEIDKSFFVLGSIHTLSYSSFRDKYAVRSLGRVQPKAYTRGGRTVAGTMVFSVFQEHELMKLAKEESKDASHPEAAMLDQITPFNLVLLFANEYGAYSALHIFDVEVKAEGQEMSIDQMLTYNTLNFYAKEMIPMKNIGNMFSSYDQMLTNVIQIVQDKNGVISEGRPGHREKIDNKIGIKDDELTGLLTQSRGLF